MTPEMEAAVVTKRRHDFANSIVGYLETRTTPLEDWREAVRETVRLVTTEARRETLACLGGKRAEVMHYPPPEYPRIPMEHNDVGLFWVVPDE